MRNLMPEPPLHLAVFGDTHGHLRLMFQLCRLWQRQQGVHLDGILQCGDLGFFPDLTRLDKATRRFADRDPEELGFAYYFRLPEPTSQDSLLHSTLGGDAESLDTVRCPVIFCHGNHEDFRELERVTSGAAMTSVDAFGRLFFLRSGEMTELHGLRVGAVGGAPELPDEEASPVLGKHVSERAVARLRRQTFDVLLTHGSARGLGGETDRWGSTLLRELIEGCQPAYHFYGHHRDPIPAANVGRTHCVWLNDVNFRRERHGQQGQIEHGCMGMLRWKSSEDHAFAIIDEPWFRQVSAATWRHR
jgi:hypothetical protein